MRVRSPLLFLAGGMLVSSTAFADVSIQIGIDSNPVTKQVNDGDPAAVSAVINTELGNTLVNVGSTAEAAGDMTAGTLRCYSVASLQPASATDFPSCTVNVSDALTFSGPGTTVQIGVTLDVDGSWSLATVNPAYVSSQYVYASLSVGPSGSPKSGMAQFYHTIDPNNGGNQFTDDGLPIDGDYTSVSAPSSPPHGVINIPYVVTIGVPIDIGATLAVNGEGDDGNEAMDFGNTARIALTVPAGYTFTSASGNFLTQAGAPGLALPPDGGVGVHGAPDAGLGGSDGGSSGSKDASIGGGGSDSGPSNNGDGGGSNGDASGSSSDDGGCNVTSASDGYGIAFAIGALVVVAGRRRRRR